MSKELTRKAKLNYMRRYPKKYWFDVAEYYGDIYDLDISDCHTKEQLLNKYCNELWNILCCEEAH